LPQEERFIEVVVEALRSLPEYVTRLVVRLNPMDDSAQIESYLRKLHPHVLVLRPDWHYVRSQNLCYQRRDDTKLLTNLLHYSSVCVNIPSTVTVECALAGLPVINLGFDLPGPQPLPGSVRAFWDVDYYANVRKSGSALLCNSPSELSALLAVCLRKRAFLQEQQHQLIHMELSNIYPPLAQQRYVKTLEAGLHG
jgi:hypothetical protein